VYPYDGYGYGYTVESVGLVQGHREFPFGNSREFGIAKFPAGIPGNFAKIAIGYFFPVISSLFVQFHYHLQQTLTVNYNVLSINHWSIISIGTKLQFRNPLGTIFWVWADRPGSYRLHADRRTEVTSFCVRKSWMTVNAFWFFLDFFHRIFVF